MSDRNHQRRARELMRANSDLKYTQALRLARDEHESSIAATGSTIRGGADPLAELIGRFRLVAPYPQPSDRKDEIANRRDMLASLTEPALESAIE